MVLYSASHQHPLKQTNQPTFLEAADVVEDL
jgi:hypothetical protein